MLDTAKKNPLGYIEYRLRDIRTKINTVASTTDEYMEAVLTADIQESGSKPFHDISVRKTRKLKPDPEPYLKDMIDTSNALNTAVNLLQVDIMQQMYVKKGGKA